MEQRDVSGGFGKSRYRPARWKPRWEQGPVHLAGGGGLRSDLLRTLIPKHGKTSRKRKQVHTATHLLPARHLPGMLPPNSLMEALILKKGAFGGGTGGHKGEVLMNEIGALVRRDEREIIFALSHAACSKLACSKAGALGSNQLVKSRNLGLRFSILGKKQRRVAFT